MKFSNMFIPTLRENPADAEIVSHSLLIRAGMIRKLSSGIYSFLPLGYRVLKKIEQVIREEMDKTGAQELLMPALLPAEIYQESGRWEVFGTEMFRLKDRNKRDFCLGPTHEEIFTGIVKDAVKSYRALPLTLYQIQTKYRDEQRPRYGMMRSREFIMKDAYSFDKEEAGLDISFQQMHAAYCRIFKRLNLQYIVAEADSGTMGGSGSREFMVASTVGEANIAVCDQCGYAANTESAACAPEYDNKHKEDQELPMEYVETPDVKTIEELVKFFNCSKKLLVKTLVYKADNKYIAALVRGDRDVNETKLKNLTGCTELELADEQAVLKITNAGVGFAGPAGLNSVDIIADLEIVKMKNFITGANKTGQHILNINIFRDFTPAVTADIRSIAEGDKCIKCGFPLKITRGIEVGHIFKLGTKYTKALNCIYLDESGTEKPMVMGCYGIGVNRTMAAIIEQNNDENGIIWPAAVAPYPVILILVNPADKLQHETANKIHAALLEHGIEVLIDDRDERPGVKFKDADLIGIPVRIIAGKKAGAGIVEMKCRHEKNSKEIHQDDVPDAVKKIITAI